MQSSFTTPLVFEEATLATTTPLIVVALVLASAFIVWRIARAFRSPLERLTYGGDRIVLIRRDESGFGPGTVVSFDLEQDGVFADEVHVDEEGLYTISLDARRLSPSGVFSMRARSADGTRTTPVVRVTARQERPSNSASEVPAGLPAQVTSSGAGPSSASAAPSAEPEICACVDCPPSTTLTGSSLAQYTHSFSPVEQGVELATGRLRMEFPVLSFETRRLGLDFHLRYTSLAGYAGPIGNGFSHSFNMMVVQTGDLAGRIVTPDLRVYEIASEDGRAWKLPDGFNSRLRLDTRRRRWTMTHFSGLDVEFFQGNLGEPGYPIALREPNGNSTQLRYDTFGLLKEVRTDLDQVLRLEYGGAGRLRTVGDPIGRTWLFAHDDEHRLVSIQTPETQYAEIGPEVEIDRSEIEAFLVTRRLVTSLSYDDPRFPSHVTSVVDPRGAETAAYGYEAQGRVARVSLNGGDVLYDYDPTTDPTPLNRLESGNQLTRVVDREGHVTDYEIHDSTGGPVENLGAYGLRRRVSWTERGRGRRPLRESEPEYREMRWLHECDCLTPSVVTEQLDSEAAKRLELDANRIPLHWPRHEYRYNSNHQIVAHVHTDGVSRIETRASYQEGGFGDDGEYSRQLTATDPRAFDDNPVYEGLEFVYTMRYDAAGNRVRRDAPTVTRGVEAPLRITESWSYNSHGQVVRHTDPNGNVTELEYNDGSRASGGMNTGGEFTGYLAREKRGARGSVDEAVELTTAYRTNALGMTTQEIDPRGLAHETRYSEVGEVVREISPPITLRSGEQVRYEDVYIHDGAGNLVVQRRSRVDYDGNSSPAAFVDRVMSYGATNRLLSKRAQIDADPANDSVTRFAYDSNDDLVVLARPEGNRQFAVRDERRLPLKVFYGVPPGDRPTDDYPSERTADDLGSTPFIGLVVEDYDSRGNNVRTRDGRGHETLRFYDVFDRQVAEADGNGNGWRRELDDAGLELTVERGALSRTNGAIESVLARSYGRFDELGRQVHTTQALDLSSDRRAEVEPGGADCATTRSVFDAASRVVASLDALGNRTSYVFDAANRETAVIDALGNEQTFSYDASSNPTRVLETERPALGAAGESEVYETRYGYDEADRRTEERTVSRDGGADRVVRYSYDSRDNLRLMTDEAGRCSVQTFDDLDREIRYQLFDAAPDALGAAELTRTEMDYDRNGRLTELRASADISGGNEMQRTRCLYDHHERLVTLIHADATDPTDGADASDLVSVDYDENSNPVRITDQRGVAMESRFDAGNRLSEQSFALPSGLPGVSRRRFEYDTLDRIVTATNDFASVERVYDALSRLIAETQSLRLDGAGHSRGWGQPIRVLSRYDLESNRTACTVQADGKTDLELATAFDALNRVSEVSGAYLGRSSHSVARYDYVGPDRVRRKQLGNGAALTKRYDGLRREAGRQWHSPSGGPLLELGYQYDVADNPVRERLSGGDELYDHFCYDGRDQLVGASYGSDDPERPESPRDTFAHDDNANRRTASFGPPLPRARTTSLSYASNTANEYTKIAGAETKTSVVHDRAGNMTRFPVKRPIPGEEPVLEVADAEWDALNRLSAIETAAGGRQTYLYDPFNRRVASLAGPEPTPQRRYVHDDWTVLEERTFAPRATLAEAPDRLERIYVPGAEIDEPLVAAIDRDGDGRLGAAHGKNTRDAAADQEYYFLGDRVGSVMALLDADDGGRVMESYRYSAHGEVVSRLEGEPAELDARISERPSQEHGNRYLFTGRRFDPEIGLYYFRHRYYEPRMGRFVSRDPRGFVDGMNLYAAYFVHRARDPFGTQVSTVGSGGVRVGSRCRGNGKGWLTSATGKTCTIPHVVMMNVQETYKDDCGRTVLWERIVFVTTHSLAGRRYKRFRVQCINGKVQRIGKDISSTNCVADPLPGGVADQLYTATFPKPGGGTTTTRISYWDTIKNLQAGGGSPLSPVFD